MCPSWDASVPSAVPGWDLAGSLRAADGAGVPPHVCAQAQQSPRSGAPSRERALGLVPRCQGRHEGLWRGLAGLPVGTPEAEAWPPWVGQARFPREGGQAREEVRPRALHPSSWGNSLMWSRGKRRMVRVARAQGPCAGCREASTRLAGSSPLLSPDSGPSTGLV